MEKKLFFQLEDNADFCTIFMTLQDCHDYMDNFFKHASPDELADFQFSLTPVFLTQEEFEAMPEMD